MESGGSFDPVQAGFNFGSGLLDNWLNSRNNEHMMHEQFDFEQKMWGMNRDLARENWQKMVDYENTMWGKNYEMQKEFAKNGIRWKVEEAKNLGFHPLYAAGMPGVQASPIGVGSPQYPDVPSMNYPGHGDKKLETLAGMGQNIARAYRAGMTAEERELHNAQLNLVKAQAKEHDMRAWYYAAEADKTTREDLMTKPLPGLDIPGKISGQPDKKVSSSWSDSSRTAGSKHPFWKNYEVVPGMTIDIPYSEEGPAEGMEGAGAFWMTLLRNLIYRPAVKAGLIDPDAKYRLKNWGDTQFSRGEFVR